MMNGARKFLYLTFFGIAGMMIGAVSPMAELDKQFVYDHHGRRDPFWKLTGPGGSVINYEKDILLSDMVLEGTMVEASGNSIAIINGKIVKVNEKVGLFVVKEILPNAVILEKGQEKFTLQLKKED